MVVHSIEVRKTGALFASLIKISTNAATDHANLNAYIKIVPNHLQYLFISLVLL